MTLYEPVFTVIARRYGSEVWRGITALTLWGEFASTVFVPLTQFLLNQTGWRNTLVALGLANLLCVALHSLIINIDASTMVAAIAFMGPAQVAGRITVWVIAERVSVRVMGKIVVLAFSIALLLLMLLPPAFASLVVYIVIYGAANGILTIVRGLAVPEMLTQEAYGAINSILAIPATITKASAPLGIALLWAATASYK
jgi:predicted MFS family arabinose efflux permease